MKIDAQGHEVDIMRGARNLYNDYVVRMVGLEFWPKGLNMAGHTSRDLVQILTTELKLFCFDLDFSSPLHPEEFSEYEEHFQQRENDFQKSSTMKHKIFKPRYGWFVELVCMNTNKVYRLAH